MYRKELEETAVLVQNLCPSLRQVEHDLSQAALRLQGLLQSQNQKLNEVEEDLAKTKQLLKRATYFIALKHNSSPEKVTEMLSTPNKIWENYSI